MIVFRFSPLPSRPGLGYNGNRNALGWKESSDYER